ncbi:hypothetical protein GOODEAATRI_032096 [Goodea atripinnis]|uniref:Uncharacterized protein n=1 Tax=Goodea atripinnis TaxID=208336 RepID=A0ABV0P9C4_9TELE
MVKPGCTLHCFTVFQRSIFLQQTGESEHRIQQQLRLSLFHTHRQTDTQKSPESLPTPLPVVLVTTHCVNHVMRKVRSLQLHHRLVHTQFVEPSFQISVENCRVYKNSIAG